MVLFLLFAFVKSLGFATNIKYAVGYFLGLYFYDVFFYKVLHVYSAHSHVNFISA